MKNDIEGLAITWISLVAICLDFFRVLEPISLDYILNKLGVSPTASLIVIVLIYPFIIALVLNLVKSRSSNDRSDK